MGALLGFLGASPARIQALLIAGLAMAATIAALTACALWWRGEAYQARGARDVAMAQAKVLASGIEACNASVEAAEQAAAAAIDGSRQLLAEARRLHAGGRAQVQRIEELLAQKGAPVRADGAAAGCDEAWTEIEKNAGAAR